MLRRQSPDGLLSCLGVPADRREERGLVRAGGDMPLGLVRGRPRTFLSHQIGQHPFQHVLLATGDCGEPVSAWSFPAPVVGWADEASAQVAGLRLLPGLRTPQPRPGLPPRDRAARTRLPLPRLPAPVARRRHPELRGCRAPPRPRGPRHPLTRPHPSRGGPHLRGQPYEPGDSATTPDVFIDSFGARWQDAPRPATAPPSSAST